MLKTISLDRMTLLRFLVMIFSLSLIFPITAYAAEPVVYTFEVMPSVSTFSDYGFISDPDSGIAFYEGFVPDGQYNIYYRSIDHYADLGEFSFASPVEISYTSEFEGFPSAVFNGTFSDPNSDFVLDLDFILCDATSSENVSLLVASLNGDFVHFPEGAYFEFISVEDDSSSCLADLYQIRDDIINTNLFGSFLICGAIVGCALLRRFL